MPQTPPGTPPRDARGHHPGQVPSGRETRERERPATPTGREDSTNNNNNYASILANLTREFQVFETENAAAARRVPNNRPRTDWVPQIYGNAVASVRDLRLPTDYVRQTLSSVGDVLGIVRLKKSSTALKDKIFQYDFTLQILRAPKIQPIYITGLLEVLWEVLTLIAKAMLALHPPETSGPCDISLSVGHREIDTTMDSGLFPLMASNIDQMLEVIMSAIFDYSQSEKFNTTVNFLDIMATVVERNLQGDGNPQLVQLSDETYRRKSYQQNTNGTIFYVESLSSCFFVALFYVIRHSDMLKEFDQLKSSRWESTLGASGRRLEKVRTLFANFSAELALKGEDLLEVVKNFFRRKDIDIDESLSGSDRWLELIAEKCEAQISIFSDSKAFERDLIAPAQYDPMKTQLHLLSTQYCTTPEEGSGRIDMREMRGHYHGLRNGRSIAGRNSYFCGPCGKFFSYTIKIHKCPNGRQCKMCHRPKMRFNSWSLLSAVGKLDYCCDLSSGPRTTRVGTFNGRGREGVYHDRCNSYAQDASCLDRHVTFCNIVRCRKCQRCIMLRGQYKDWPNLKQHDNCDETYCEVIK